MAKRIVHKHTLVKCKQVRPDQIEFGEIAIQAHEYGPYLQVKDRSGEVIRVGGVIFADHQPPCAQKGAWWVKVDTTVDPIEYSLYIFQGKKWVPLCGGNGGGNDVEISCCDVYWPDIIGKPDCFEPCEHTHKWPDIEEKPDCFPPCEHEHDFPEPNDGKLTIKDDEDNVLGEFTANQEGDTEVIIPASDGCCDWEDIPNKPCIPECHDWCEECLEAKCRYVGTPSLDVLLDWLGENKGYGYDHCCICGSEEIEEPQPVFEIWMHDGKNPWCIYDFARCWTGSHQLHYRLADGTEGIFHTYFEELIESDDMFHHVRMVPLEKDVLPLDQEFEVFIVHEEEPDLIACHHPDHDDWVYWDNIIGIPPDIFDPDLHLPSLPRVYDLKDDDLLLISRNLAKYSTSTPDWHEFAIQGIHAKEYFRDVPPTMDDGRPLVHVIIHSLENGKRKLGLTDKHAPYWVWKPNGESLGQLDSIPAEITEAVIGVGSSVESLFYAPYTNNDLCVISIGHLTNTSKVTDMKSMFNRLTKFTGAGVEYLDTTNVTNMDSMFYGCSQFNGDVSGWDTSQCTNMTSMFRQCKQFNQDISGWDMSNCENMNYMLRDAWVFDQDISGWDTHRATRMSYTFKDARAFQGSANSDLSEWCVPEIKTRPNGWSDDTVTGEPVWGTCPRGEWVFDWHDLYETD